MLKNIKTDTQIHKFNSSKILFISINFLYDHKTFVILFMQNLNLKHKCFKRIQKIVYNLI